MSKQKTKQGRQASQLFHAVDRQRFGASTCFLCGRRLGNRNRTDEHVFPKWLLRRFELWDSRLVLLNGTPIQYKDLKIPCCASCNGTHLSEIEKQVEAALAAGTDGFSALPETLVCAWLSKILYGLIYKQGFLKLRREQPRGRPIITRALLESFNMHHLLMQSIRVPFAFARGWPGSLFIFRVQAPTKRVHQFDFKDEVTSLAISLRLGKVGILAALQDGGAMDGFRPDFAKYVNTDLHPLQFLELTAQFFYKTRLLRRFPRLTVMETPRQVIIRHSPYLTGSPVFDEWRVQTYAQFFAVLSGFPLERVFEPPNRTLSWLNDGRGNVPFISLADQPWPVVGLGPEIDVRR